MAMTNTLTIPEAAGYLGIKPSQAYRLRRKGILVEVPSTGNAARVSRASVEAYAATRHRGRPQKPIEQVGERQRHRRKQT